jgi:hypothetical protein
MRQKHEGDTPQDYARRSHQEPPCILCGRRNAYPGHNLEEVRYLLGSRMKNVVQILWGEKS